MALAEVATAATLGGWAWPWAASVQAGSTRLHRPVHGCQRGAGGLFVGRDRPRGEGKGVLHGVQCAGRDGVTIDVDEAADAAHGRERVPVSISVMDLPLSEADRIAKLIPAMMPGKWNLARFISESEEEENKLEKVITTLIQPKVLVLDEIGYMPMSREDASLFFRVITRRYEKASTILSSNKSFVDWGEVFGDPVLATAILDRLLHHATTLNIKGESYRLKEKRRAGLLGASQNQKPETHLTEEELLAELNTDDH